jgi:cell division protein FtsA
MRRMLYNKSAELLKVKFDLFTGENKDNEIVSIPGLRGESQKRFLLKNLSKNNSCKSGGNC